jgi:pSer/pThr/pTyr-binding forkhead associated (FHA) protein
VGLLAIAGVYLISRKKTPEPPKPPSKPEPVFSRTEESEPAPVKRPGTMVSFMFPPPGKGQPAAYLDGITGKARGERFPIEQKITHIGAGDDNELRVEDEYVSRRHAAIRYDSGNLYLSDSGSRNKTFLNDAELRQTAMALTPGDQIRVGKTTFQVRAPGDRAPQPHDKTVPPETRVP